MGDFFVFDKNIYGRYFLATERKWHVDKLNFADHPDYMEGFKLNELTERTGGSDLDTYIAHLWYLKEGIFIEAWKGTLEERSFFQRNMFLRVGGYRYVEKFTKLFTWSSEYSIKVDTNTPIGKPTTTISIYKFDGSKFIPEVKKKYEHTKAFPNILFCKPKVSFNIMHNIQYMLQCLYYRVIFVNILHQQSI